MNVVDRFLKYVSFDTASDPSSTTTPSTAKQKLLGEYLAKELCSIGFENAHMDDDGYVYAFLPATSGCEDIPSIGFIAHMDTSPDVSGRDVKPSIVDYNGGDIQLSDNIRISLESYPFLENYKGQQLIVTDGTTLLGGDDKAGIAEIITACQFLLDHPEIPHGKICIGITPDEEIGRGADKFDISGFGADWAYTVDGGTLGEVVYENFNAAGARFKINGINIHPGSAKNRMKNSVLIASELISMLPSSETPAHTECREGFYHVSEISGDESYTAINMIIRDHNRDAFERRKTFVKNLVNYLNTVYGQGTVELEMEDSYYNMEEKIRPAMHIIENAVSAMRECGVKPFIEPMRGGTDGARLSFDGLLCPNLSTGGENFHSVYEFISVQSMEKMVEILVKLMSKI